MPCPRKGLGEDGKEAVLPWSEETPKAGVSTGTQLLNTGGGGAEGGFLAVGHTMSGVPGGSVSWRRCCCPVRSEEEEEGTWRGRSSPVGRTA